jgi:hypothetical protein
MRWLTSSTLIAAVCMLAGCNIGTTQQVDEAWAQSAQPIAEQVHADILVYAEHDDARGPQNVLTADAFLLAVNARNREEAARLWFRLNDGVRATYVGYIRGDQLIDPRIAGHPVAKRGRDGLHHGSRGGPLKAISDRKGEPMSDRIDLDFSQAGNLVREQLNGVVSDINNSHVQKFVNDIVADSVALAQMRVEGVPSNQIARAENALRARIETVANTPALVASKKAAGFRSKVQGIVATVALGAMNGFLMSKGLPPVVMGP